VFESVCVLRKSGGMRIRNDDRAVGARSQKSATANPHANTLGRYQTVNRVQETSPRLLYIVG
jgi:hypothetical protein